MTTTVLKRPSQLPHLEKKKSPVKFQKTCQKALLETSPQSYVRVACYNISTFLIGELNAKYRNIFLIILMVRISTFLVHH